MIKRFSAMLFGLVLMLSGCHDTWMMVEMSVDNNSSDSLLVYVALGLANKCPTSYPDTLLPEFVEWNNECFVPLLDTVPPYALSHRVMAEPYNDHMSEDEGHERYFDWIGVDTLSVFFMKKDSVNKYGYDYVARNNIICARYDLSIENLKLLSYKIPYPPTAAIGKVWSPK